MGDDNVRAEIQKVYNDPNVISCPLLLRNLRKVYPGGKIAIKGISLAVEKGIIFGLLGPNGAGKSSLIHCLTGLYPPTSGDAYVAGYNIKEHVSEVYYNIGVCPQHDIHWGDLVSNPNTTIF